MTPPDAARSGDATIASSEHRWRSSSPSAALPWRARWWTPGCSCMALMLAARGSGLDTCAQASLTDFHTVVRRHVTIPDDHVVVCGVALGYADERQRLSSQRTTREPVSSFATFYDSDGQAAVDHLPLRSSRDDRMPGNLPTMTDLSTPITTARPRPAPAHRAQAGRRRHGRQRRRLPRRRRTALRPAGPRRDAAARDRRVPARLRRDRLARRSAQGDPAWPGLRDRRRQRDLGRRQPRRRDRRLGRPDDRRDRLDRDAGRRRRGVRRAAARRAAAGGPVAWR